MRPGLAHGLLQRPLAMCESARASDRRRREGFTLLEMVVVIAIIGIMAAVSAPKLEQYFSNQRARDAARDVANAFRIAQAEAIRTGDPHIVYLTSSAGGNPPATDPQGTSIGAAPGGAPWPLAIVDDGTPALSNCHIDPGEAEEHVVSPAIGVSWGFSLSAGAVAPGDVGGGNPASGSTFTTRPGGPATTWVMFRPDGIPVGFDAACTLGGVGSGGGGVYITNGNRDYAVVLSPLGGVKVHVWNAGVNAWTN